ncbi:SAG-related sequence SRS38D [Toxoplasma gondii VAND]|uniref:SAG-related sequence SRS38D n=1 Tax=Toxoplasma gondii VAND TaxID=933077 RepID=A0A086PN31_TOXGO|nr:SAG-related sequence SRS38D [Toxoplasma gondii VAND]
MAYTIMVGEVSVAKARSSTTPFSLARVVKVRLSSASRLGCVALLLLASATGLPGYPSSFLIRALADESQVSSVCVPGEGVTKCTCAAQESTNPKALEASFSEKLSALELACEQQSFAPEDPDNKRVCPADTSDFKDCKDNQANTKSIDLTTLLTGDTESIKWETVTREAQGTTKKLSIPPANLPYTDQSFAVGCLDSSKTTAKCKLTVTIEARASVTQDQIVTCAYGKTSNQKHQSIKLSPSQNKFTLVCGKDGEVLPTNYQSTFCVRKDGVDARAECSGNYTDVIPAYETQWWKHDAAQHTFTLEIPEGGFPEKETQIMVGCQKSKKAAGTDKEVREEASSDSPTVCSVDVTIEAVASSASLSGGVAGVFSWFCSVGAFLTVSCLMM